MGREESAGGGGRLALEGSTRFEGSRKFEGSELSPDNVDMNRLATPRLHASTHVRSIVLCVTRYPSTLYPSTTRQKTFQVRKPNVCFKRSCGRCDGAAGVSRNYGVIQVKRRPRAVNRGTAALSSNTVEVIWSIY